jgi:hypothetical protein
VAKANLRGHFTPSAVALRSVIDPGPACTLPRPTPRWKREGWPAAGQAHPGPVRRSPTPYRSPDRTRMGSPRPRQAWGRPWPSPGAIRRRRSVAEGPAAQCPGPGRPCVVGRKPSDKVGHSRSTAADLTNSAAGVNSPRLPGVMQTRAASSHRARGQRSGGGMTWVSRGEQGRLARARRSPGLRRHPRLPASSPTLASQTLGSQTLGNRIMSNQTPSSRTPGVLPPSLTSAGS